MKENKMKPRRVQRRTGSQWQGKGVTTEHKSTMSKARPKLGVASSAHLKPLTGKVFYLDLPSTKTAERLESDIKHLGGTVEKFFSKEIKYLVSNKKEARYAKCLRQDCPVPSLDSRQSSPNTRSKPHQTGSNGDNIKRCAQGQTDTLVPSRGKSLVERVVKEQERIQLNKILSNAVEWGVNILYIDDVMAYVHKKKKLVSSHCPTSTAVKTSVKKQQAKQSLQKCKGGRISKPFIKVEDSTRQYRPIYLTMPNMPEFNLKTIPPCSPFCADDKDPSGNKYWVHRGASEERAHSRKKNRDKKRGGYCECCVVKYENLTTHLQSERHKAFSKSDEYVVVDRLVSTLHCSFIHVKRPKCSESSVLVAPGPCVKTELRHMRNVDNRKEQHWADNGCESSFSGHHLGIKSVPGSAALTHTEGERKNSYPYSYTSRHKYLTRKQPRRQHSLTTCTIKADQHLRLRFRTETAPSRGQSLAFCPSADSSTSLFHNVNAQNEISSKAVHLTTNQQEGSDTKKDFLFFEPVVDRNILIEKGPENRLTEREEGSFPTQSFSPVRKIRRKIRVYRRKRRDVDTQLEHFKQNDDNSLLKLWEHFQSSDDMDVEFHGFED